MKFRNFSPFLLSLLCFRPARKKSQPHSTKLPTSEKADRYPLQGHVTKQHPSLSGYLQRNGRKRTSNYLFFPFGKPNMWRSLYETKQRVVLISPKTTFHSDKKTLHETHGTIGISMEWKSTQNSQGNKPSWVSGYPSISPKIQLQGPKHQVAHHLWQLLEPPEDNFLAMCFATNIFRKVQCCFGILLIFVKWLMSLGNMYNFSYNQKKTPLQIRVIGLYIISDTKTLLLTHVAVLGQDPCGMHVATSETCSNMLCSVYPISWSKLLTSHSLSQIKESLIHFPLK